jgi:hypothetical protein
MNFTRHVQVPCSARATTSVRQQHPRRARTCNSCSSCAPCHPACGVQQPARVPRCRVHVQLTLTLSHAMEARCLRPQQHATAAPALGNHATALSLSAVLRIVWAVTAPGPGVSAWADRCCRADARCTSPDAPQCLHPALIASGIPTPYSLYIQVDCQASYCALLPRIGEPRRQHSFRRAHAQHRASGEPGINACTVLLAPACPWDVAARSQIDASPHGVQSLGAVQAAVQATGRQCRPHHQADTGTQGPP